MAIINSIIPKQNFELVNERIGVILKLELENQKTLQGFAEPVNVFNERMEAFKATEEVMVNTFFDGSNENSHAQKSTQGNVTYFVDIYASGKARSGVDGGKDSTSKLHKFIGMCRYILSHSEYRTLGFAPGIIGGVYVENIQTATPKAEDAAFVSMARMTFSVKLTENQPLLPGTLLNKSLTGVKLDLTQQGYKYELTN